VKIIILHYNYLNILIYIIYNMNKINNILSKLNYMKLSQEQYIEIYKIIKLDKNIKIMKNNNGIFVDLENLDNIILEKLEKLIYYISTNELSQNI